MDWWNGMLPTSGQIRAARGFLNWTMQRLADEAKVSLATVVRAERAEGEPPISPAKLEHIRAALEGAGIEFTSGDIPGVRLRLPAWSRLGAAAVLGWAVNCRMRLGECLMLSEGLVLSL